LLVQTKINVKAINQKLPSSREKVHDEEGEAAPTEETNNSVEDPVVSLLRHMA
jgi:hypothetical protein